MNGSKWATRNNLAKCRHTDAIVDALLAHQPPIPDRDTLLGIVTLTCPAPSARLLELRRQSAGLLAPLPGVLPGRPAAISFAHICPTLLRINGSRHDARREDKVACSRSGAAVLASPCRVLSVGSNGEPEFEESVHAMAAACAIDTWDGTLGARKRARLPPFLRFVPRNFKASSWREYVGRGHLAILKMDCEGCEFQGLLPFVERVCAQQVILELHAYPRLLAAGASSRSHRDAAGGSPKRVAAEHFAPLASFFARMARLRYRPFYGEYNPSCGPHVRCWEISWYRSEECTD